MGNEKGRRGIKKAEKRSHGREKIGHRQLISVSVRFWASISTDV